MTLKLDTREGTAEYYINSESLGVAFNNIFGD